MINEQFFLMYLSFFGLTCILYKDGLLPNWICETGESLYQSKNKVKKKTGELLQELSSCFFCMDNWIGTFLFAIPISIYNQDFHYLIIGFLFASISAHFRA